MMPTIRSFSVLENEKRLLLSTMSFLTRWKRLPKTLLTTLADLSKGVAKNLSERWYLSHNRANFGRTQFILSDARMYKKVPDDRLPELACVSYVCL